MSKLTFASTYAEKRETTSYCLQDALYSSQSQIAIQTGDVQAKPEASGNEHGPVCGQCSEKRVMEKGMLEYYLQSATIHGVAQTNGPHLYNYRRPLWFILIFGMAVMLGWTLFEEISHLKKYPSRTVSTVSLRDELTFPAVTICNLNQYYIDRVPNIPIVRTLLTYQSDYSALLLRSTLPDISSMSDVPGEELIKMARLAAPRLDELLVRCSWSMRNYNCSDLFRAVYTGHGKCFVFNGPAVPREQLAKVYGTMSKLRVTSVLDNERSYFSSVIHAGLKVIVQERDHAVLPFPQGSYVRPGVAALLAISRSDSKGLPRPYMAYKNNYCVDTKAADFVNPLRYYDTYYRSHCISECILQRLFKLCGCLHFLSASADQGPLCSAKQLLTCYLQQASKIQINNVVGCKCPMECHSVTYSADVSYANIASNFIEQQAVRDGITLLSGPLRQNMADVSIYFKTLNIMEHEQEPATTMSSILGSLGGQMGLFLGASILSITELVEFLVLWSMSKIKQFNSWVRGKCTVHP